MVMLLFYVDDCDGDRDVTPLIINWICIVVDCIRLGAGVLVFV